MRKARREDDDAAEPSARAIDTASLSFGLVAIPVRVYSTSEPTHEVHFHMIHKGCGKRLKQQYVCPEHGPVERDDIAKGYAPDRSSIIELDKGELAALEAVGGDEIAFTEFVPASAVDPIFVDRTYYLGPDRGGARAYRLLREALVDAELVGIATYAARGKAYVVMVRPFETGLAMHQLRYPDEIKPWSVVGLKAADKPTAQELALAKQLVDQLANKTFDASKYHDEVKDRVRALLADKVKHGKAIAADTEDEATAAAPSSVPDLMAALKASLGAGAATDHDKPKPKAKAAAAARSHRPARKSTTRHATHRPRTRAASSHARARR